jgi:hypothetical protein
VFLYGHTAKSRRAGRFGTPSVSGRETGYLGLGADTWWEGHFFGILGGASLERGGGFGAFLRGSVRVAGCAWYNFEALA